MPNTAPTEPALATPFLPLRLRGASVIFGRQEIKSDHLAARNVAGVSKGEFVVESAEAVDNPTNYRSVTRGVQFPRSRPRLALVRQRWDLLSSASRAYRDIGCIIPLMTRRSSVDPFFDAVCAF